MRNSKNIFVLAAGILALAACKPNVETPAASQGSADFTRYIAVGNSLTSGYADNGLYRESQLTSFPAIIAQQMQQVGGGPFAQPLFSEEQANGSGYLKLTGFTADGSPITTNVTEKRAIRDVITVPTGPTTTTSVTLYTKYTGDLNNYGVPGIKLIHATIPGYGNLNGYFERMLPGNAPTTTNTYLDFVTAKPFTFFTNWLGNNDALGYATSGGAGDVLTPKADFTTAYNVVINKLTAGGQKGAIATIPDVTAIPYFNTVTVGAILASVQKANPAAAALYINARSSAADATVAYGPRAATANDLIVLTFPTSKIGTPTTVGAVTVPYGLHPLAPIENQYVLDVNEIALTRSYVDSYNTTIRSVAAAKNLALVDMNKILTDMRAGTVIDGISLNGDFIKGGLFSLDGVHLTPRGYASVANNFIQAINLKYGSTIPQVSLANYRAVKFP